MNIDKLEKLERQRRIIRQQRDNFGGKPSKQLFGVRVKEWNKPSKLFSLCDGCLKSIEPPTRVKMEGESGTRFCDWCDIKNIV